jgi:integrase
MGKRGNGEGGITRHKKSGLYMARYTVQTAAGPKRKTVYGKTRKEAAEKLTKAMADGDGGLVFDARNQTVGEYLDRWLKDSVRGSVKPVTFENRQQLVHNHIALSLGRIKLKNLTPAHVQGLYRAKLDAGLAPSSVRLLHSVLHKALKQPGRWELVPRNVCEAVDPPKLQTEEIQALDAEQAKALLEAARGDCLEALYVLAITAGLRIGELLGLKWEDVDLERCALNVRRTLSAAKSGPTFTTPKNNKGRSIKLTERAVDALKIHKAAQNTQRLKLPADLWEDWQLVFPTRRGTPLGYRNLTSRSFKSLLSRAELPQTVRFHDLRHTCATLLLSRGVHPKLVQELLGHATIAMTLDRYSHVLPGMGDQTATAMESALS